jgi:RNA polymerase sigma-70 factor (ECF subfamily)
MADFPSTEHFGAREAHAPVFATTHWSIVLAARASESAQAGSALESLCRSYWYPLYAFVRRQGHHPEDAADLTQAFFSRLLSKGILAFAMPERGRFRSFLIAGLKNVLANEWDRAQAQKRGGGTEIFSLDAADAERLYALEPAERFDPAQLFDRRWALTLLDEALRRLEAEQLAANKGRIFQRLQRFLMGDEGAGNYAEAARDLELSEAAVKMAVMRLLARCRELLRDEIARTVSAPLEIEQEYRALLAALRS